MLMDIPAVERLVNAFRKLPGVGKRSAERLALHLLSAPPDEATFISEAIRDARACIRQCEACNDLTDISPCAICRDHDRDATLLCVVEYPSSVMALEKGGDYRGKYHVLHGALNPLDGVGPSELRMDLLFHRVEQDGVREVIVATNTTAEGEVTASYISRQLGKMDVACSRIAHGVPMGGGLDYADEATLSRALQGRTRI